MPTFVGYSALQVYDEHGPTGVPPETASTRCDPPRDAAMGGVVFVIGEQYPEHWQRALEAGFWETVPRKSVSRGDLLLFWQAGRRQLLGAAVATHDTEDAEYGIQSRPWLTRDPTTYRFRYRFNVLPGSGAADVTWRTLMTDLGQNPQRGANTAPVTFAGDGRALLERIKLDLGGVAEKTGDQPSVGEALLRRELSSSSRQVMSGRDYSPADEQVTSVDGVVFQRDPEAVDRGLRAHARTQNALAEWLASNGISVFSPHGLVNFDIGWTRSGQDFVGEVKSLHELNEREQMRLGIGQVLEFAYRTDARPVLVVEREPSAAHWGAVCDRAGIKLVWPGNFDPILDG